MRVDSCREAARAEQAREREGVKTRGGRETMEGGKVSGRDGGGEMRGSRKTAMGRGRMEEGDRARGILGDR